MSTTSAPPQNFQSQESFALARGFLVRSTANRLADHETVGATYSTPGARKCSKPTQRYAYARADSSVRARAKALACPSSSVVIFRPRARQSFALSPPPTSAVLERRACRAFALSFSLAAKERCPTLKTKKGMRPAYKVHRTHVSCLLRIFHIIVSKCWGGSIVAPQTPKDVYPTRAFAPSA